MRLFHISHTDLDGYACQFLTNKVFSKSTFYNANYGLEVKQALKQALIDIEKHKDEKLLFIISDLNLTPQESAELDKNIDELKEFGCDITLQLLDHHISGKKSSEKYDWYFLDDKRCATKIVFDYLKDNFDAKIDEYKELVDTINAVDIWLENEVENFEFGKVLMSSIIKAREINSILFASLDREYKFYILDKAKDYLNFEDRHIILDNDMHKIKKDFLKENKDDTLDNLSAKYLVKSLDTIKDELTIVYNGQKGLMTYCLGSISIPANSFLRANSDYDFFIDINKKGNASFRADGKLDVSQLAMKLANGGGHINASGCKFEDFVDSIYIQDIKKYIQNKLDNLK
ncbi:3',5'-cyclic-nucleotide phosphodiesterase [Aliarcobacter thereius]|uniref:3',5'-cyclic-nucleotide phosphodiesterase n=1 Tax=Aliarcobacter thereius TaxID=544718 RepID=A0A1C0B839_9BACT|nr:phosphoesterase [Aliarcobacter thereius]OCL87690.1 3',5'-cyclic-nucleotide phosphodiesterase [Aliarcobacter thereius]OCL93946.1 3',5'-cyclic-nucleotide phosphodiesterase [Aliarcobacter thereius]OCL99766.1 3',5'-cyclic-nucleotide phosphodiesterase [Aliarcobacter thereius]TLS73135.1 phosphoesterase [Aliarcobacter thereius]HJE03188.1 phosphoesterase [Aliarcobacter thereius]